MDRPNTIQLPVREPNPVDFETASASIEALNGTVWVEMDSYPEKIGSLYLPETVSGHLRPDAGTVIAVDQKLLDISVGDRVLVKPYAGNWFRNFWVGPYEANGEVRVYGISTWDDRLPEKRHWWEDVLASFEGSSIKAKGDWLFMRRDPIAQTHSGLVLTEREKYRNQKATVISAGPQSGLKPGARVMYHNRALAEFFDFEFAKEFGLEGDPDDYAFIRASGVYGVLPGE